MDPQDDYKDPFLGLTMADVARLSHKDYLFYKAIQRSHERAAKDKRREERNARIEAQQAKRQADSK